MKREETQARKNRVLTKSLLKEIAFDAKESYATKWQDINKNRKNRLSSLRHYKMAFVLSSFPNVLTLQAIWIGRGTSTFRNPAAPFFVIEMALPMGLARLS